MQEIKLKKVSLTTIQYLSVQFNALLSGSINYGHDGPTAKMMLSILFEVGKKFHYNFYGMRQKTYTKSLKYHEAFALLGFVNYLLESEQDDYSLALLRDLQLSLDKKI